MAPRGRTTKQLRDIRKTILAKQPALSSLFSLSHQDYSKTRRDTKQRTAEHRTTTKSHNGSNDKTTAPERTAAQDTLGSNAFY